jgi:hypothetical protein
VVQKRVRKRVMSKMKANIDAATEVAGAQGSLKLRRTESLSSK